MPAKTTSGFLLITRPNPGLADMLAAVTGERPPAGRFPDPESPKQRRWWGPAAVIGTDRPPPR